MLGIKHFTAIINPPQACILAVSAAHDVLLPATPSNPLDELMGLGQPEALDALVQAPVAAKATPPPPADILDELMAASPRGAANLPPSLQSQQIMTVTLSSDERVVDGQIAAQLLNRVEHYLASPQNMIL